MTAKFQFEDVRHDAEKALNWEQDIPGRLPGMEYDEAVVALVKVTEAAQRLSERAGFNGMLNRGALDTEIAALTEALSAFEFPEGRS